LKIIEPGSNEYFVVDARAGQVRVWADQHVVADGRRMAPGAADDGVFHDHAVASHHDRAAVGGEDRAGQDAASGSDGDVAGEDGVGRVVGIGVDAHAGNLRVRHMT
jgi:hypothetical protein